VPGSRQAPDRRLHAVALVLAALLSAASGQDSVRKPFEAGRFAEALEAASALEDPLLRAEWRFHVLYTAGDLPGALEAAMEGLRSQPGNPALLVNATQCALELGFAERAAPLAERLSEVASDPAQRSRAAALLDQSRALLSRRESAERALARAKGVALLGLAVSLASLALFARGAVRGCRARPWPRPAR
jgi:predicted Zn-dependent protease